MKIIYTTKREPILVDDEDFYFLIQNTWHLNTYGYAVARVNLDRSSMHRLIASKHGFLSKQEIDHIDRNKTNNQKKNLRPATVTQNKANIPKKVDNTSGYKGVSWDTRAQKFRAYIKYQGKFRHLGYFDCAIKAAEAYDCAARKYFGEFACLNFQESNNVFDSL